MEGQTAEVQERIVPLDNVHVIDVTEELTKPGRARVIFDTLVGDDTKAVILNTVVSGTVPDEVVPLIKECTDKGVSVFVLAGNYGTDHGILEAKYVGHTRPIAAGAIPIRDVNVNHLGEVAQTVQGAINEGKSGQDLKSAIIDKYGTVPQAMPQK